MSDPKPKTINGYRVTVSQSCMRGESSRLPSDDGTCPEGYESHWMASIANKWHHLESVGPFTSEDDAWKAARKRTAERKREDNAAQHWVNRRF